MYWLYIFVTTGPALKPCLFNFFSAGRKGIFKTQSGLQIAYLSGVDKSDAPEVYH